MFQMRAQPGKLQGLSAMVSQYFTAAFSMYFSSKQDALRGSEWKH